MEFALPGKSLDRQFFLGRPRPGGAASASALGQLDGRPNLDFINDLSQFRVVRGTLAVRQEVGEAFQFAQRRSEEHTSELQSLMRISYAVFCLKKKTTINTRT